MPVLEPNGVELNGGLGVKRLDESYCLADKFVFNNLCKR